MSCPRNPILKLTQHCRSRSFLVNQTPGALLIESIHFLTPTRDEK